MKKKDASELKILLDALQRSTRATFGKGAPPATRGGAPLPGAVQVRGAATRARHAARRVRLPGGMSVETLIQRGLIAVLALAFAGTVWWNFSGEDGWLDWRTRQAERSVAETERVLDLSAEELPGPPPSFDVVRVEPGGSALLAGRAAPGAEVVVLLDGAEVGKAEADRRGEWVLLPSEQLEVGSHRLDLEARREGFRPRLSRDVVVIEVPEGQPADKSQVFLLGREAGAEPRVLQGNPIGGLVVGALRLEAVDYDQQGNATIRGRAPSGGRVYLILDGTPIGETFTATNGVWRLEPDAPIAEGSHELRVELRDVNQRILWKLKAPFERHGTEFLTDRGAITGEDAEGRPADVSRFIVVEPGNSLWVIARRELGSGFLYSVIFDQNRETIEDPHLIFPGQVFEVPLETP